MTHEETSTDIADWDHLAALAQSAPGTLQPDASRELFATAIPGVIAAGTKTQLLRAGLQGTEGVIALPDGSVLFGEIDTNYIIHIDLADKFSTYLISGTYLHRFTGS